MQVHELQPSPAGLVSPFVHPSGMQPGMHCHCPPAHVQSRHPFGFFLVSPAAQAGCVGSTHPRSVHSQAPPEHVQELQPSPAGLVAPSTHTGGGQKTEVQAHPPPVQVQVLQPLSGERVSPSLQGGWPPSGTQLPDGHTPPEPPEPPACSPVTRPEHPTTTIETHIRGRSHGVDMFLHQSMPHTRRQVRVLSGDAPCPGAERGTGWHRTCAASRVSTCLRDGHARAGATPHITRTCEPSRCPPLDTAGSRFPAVDRGPRV